jgi:hypothetical protein
VVLDAYRPRAASAIALENAVEGCVRETFGAALALWQAGRAADPEIRSAMSTIADDETRHAELAWDFAAWLEPQLTDAERDQIHAARERAIAELNLGRPRSFDAALGLPDPESGRQLLKELRARVWRCAS